MKKRILSIILAVAVIACMIPFGSTFSFAKDEKVAGFYWESECTGENQYELSLYLYSPDISVGSYSVYYNFTDALSKGATVDLLSDTSDYVTTKNYVPAMKFVLANYSGGTALPCNKDVFIMKVCVTNVTKAFTLSKVADSARTPTFVKNSKGEDVTSSFTVNGFELQLAPAPGTFADLQQLIYDAADGGTIKLTKNYIWGKDDDDPLMIQNRDSTGKTLTIDMNGHKISGDSDYSCIAVDRWIEEGTTSKLTLIDNSESGGGTICSGGSGVYVNERGTLIAKNIKFTGNETGVYNSECCMIIENCEFTGNEYGISNSWTMAVTDTTVTGNEYGIANNGGDLYIGGSTKVTDNEEANIYLEKDTNKYTGESAWADEFYDLAPFTLGDGTTQIEALGNYVVKAPSNDFKAGITTWERESSTPMYYDDEFNMDWYPDWDKTENVKDEACAGAFTTNGTADDVKYFFADDTTYSVAYNSKGYLELVAPVTATFNPKDHWTNEGTVSGSKTFGSNNEVTATFTGSFYYDGWGVVSIDSTNCKTASVTISVPAGSVISKVTFNYKFAGASGVFTSAVGNMSETVKDPVNQYLGSNEWTGSANSVTFTLTDAMAFTSFVVFYIPPQGTSHTHKASENYMANASAHWFACSGDDCSLNGKTDAETLANYEAAFADKDTGEALKTTLGYTAHSGMFDFKCDVCNYEDVAGAIESIKTELGAAKSKALCDEARAAFDTAIENVEKATTLEGVNNARETGIDNAVKADVLFSQSVTEAKAKLGKAKSDAKSDEAKAEIDEALANLEKATNLKAVEDEMISGLKKAGETEDKFNRIVKDAKAQLEEVKRNSKSDEAKAEIDAALANLEKATNIKAVDDEMISGLKKAGETEDKFGKEIEAAKAKLEKAKSDAKSDEAKAECDTAIANLDKATNLKAVEEEIALGLKKAEEQDVNFNKAVAKYKAILGDAKSKAKSDEAKAIIDAAIANVEKATNLNTITGETVLCIKNVEKAEAEFSKAVEEAKAKLEKAKSDAKSDEAKAEIDTALANLEKATSLKAVDDEKTSGLKKAEEAETAFEKAVKDAKDALDSENSKDPLNDESSLTAGKENIEKATSLKAVSEAKLTAVGNIQKAQAQELAKAKEAAKAAIDEANAKNPIDEKVLAEIKNNIDNSKTKTEVVTMKDEGVKTINDENSDSLSFFKKVISWFQNAFEICYSFIIIIIEEIFNINI